MAEQTQRLVEKVAETERKRAVIEAEKESMVAAIKLNRTLAQKFNEQRVAQIENEMQLAKIKAEADAELYRAKKEAEANQLRLTPEFIALETARALSNNTKIYFGEKIPNIFLENQLSMPTIVGKPSSSIVEEQIEGVWSSNIAKEQD